MALVDGNNSPVRWPNSFLYYFAYMISLFCSIKKKMISLFCIILINVVLEFDCGCMLVDLAIEMSI